jgi:hypothetical protein
VRSTGALASDNRIVKALRGTEKTTDHMGANALNGGYQEALVRPYNNMMEAKTLIERYWRRRANGAGKSEIPLGPSHNIGKRSIVSGNIVYTQTPGNNVGYSFPAFEPFKTKGMTLQTEGLTKIDTTGDRIFAGYHGSKGKTEDLLKGYRPSIRDPVNPYPGNERLGLGLYCTFDRTVAEGFAGPRGSVSEVWINLNNEEKLNVYQYPDNIKQSSNGKFMEHEFKNAARKDPNFLQKAEKLEANYDVLSGPYINTPDVGGEFRVALQNKINNHMLKRKGCVEFLPAD